MKPELLGKTSESKSRISPSGRIGSACETDSAAPNPLFDLQRTIGNQAVLHLLESHAIQAKLRVSQPGDSDEIEADRVAEQVTNLSNRTGVQRKCSCESGGATCAKCHEGEEPVIQRQAGSRAGASETIGNDFSNSLGPGRALDPSLREDMESRFGHDFRDVRIHTDSQAAESARAVDARAFTLGRDVVFDSGEYAPHNRGGKQLLAHELTHVVQQGGTTTRVQRYEAGEHAQLGETQEELKAALSPATYVVKKGETLNAIAKKFGITLAELKEANKDKLKKWPAKKDAAHLVEGFNAGETISIPKKLNDLAKSVIKDKSAKFVVNGVVLDYGQVIAMGDFFESREQMAAAPPEELTELAALIDREKKSGIPVTTPEWQKATRGRYLELAEKNVAHFAPPNADRVKQSAAGAAGPNHKTEWEKNHQAALEASKSRDKDKALMINAFGDHFLTDAFSAGHLINKSDVMEMFKSQLKVVGKGDDRGFTNESKKFFDGIADATFTGDVKKEFSKYESTEKTGGLVRVNIDAAWVFSRLLQRIHLKEPDLLANAVAKGVHDLLNTLPGGLPVENEMGDSWQLSGDNTLNAKTKEIARRAVAQSQLNVVSVFGMKDQLSLPILFKKVWDFTPRPSAAGLKQLVAEVKKGTEVDSADLKNSVMKLIQDNYKLIIDKLLERGKLRKA